MDLVGSARRNASIYRRMLYSVARRAA